MRAILPCVLGLVAAACAGASVPKKAPQAVASPPATPPAPVQQAPPASGTLVRIGWVAPQDHLSFENIEAVLEAHGLTVNWYLMVPESQADFAAEVLRAEGPRRGAWGLAEPYAQGFRPEAPPEEADWPVLATDITYEEALSRFSEETTAGGVLRLPVTRVYSRVFPRLIRFRGYTRIYKDAALADHEGLEGELVLGPGDLRAGVAFHVRFQSCDGGTRVPWKWWFHFPLVGAIPEPGPDHAPWSAVVEVQWALPDSEGWVLETLDGAGLAAFPLPERQAKDSVNVLPQRYAVPASDAGRARELLRASKPAWVIASVLEE